MHDIIHPFLKQCNDGSSEQMEVSCYFLKSSCGWLNTRCLARECRDLEEEMGVTMNLTGRVGGFTKLICSAFTM